MKIRLLALLAAATAVTSMNAFAHDDSQKLCYPLLNHEGKMGSKNSVYTPFMRTANKWSSHFYLTNTSDKNLNVKIVLRTQDGEIYTPTQYTLDGGFSSINSPFDHVVGGAILQPFKTGQVIIQEDHFTQNFTGQITWQADACLEHAMTGALKVQNGSSNRLDQGLVLFNGGQPF